MERNNLVSLSKYIVNYICLYRQRPIHNILARTIGGCIKKSVDITYQVSVDG